MDGTMKTALRREFGAAIDMLDNLRHVQDHTAQLNLILGQKTGWNPDWVAMSKVD